MTLDFLLVVLKHLATLLYIYVYTLGGRGGDIGFAHVETKGGFFFVG